MTELQASLKPDWPTGLPVRGAGLSTPPGLESRRMPASDRTLARCGPGLVGGRFVCMLQTRWTLRHAGPHVRRSYHAAAMLNSGVDPVGAIKAFGRDPSHGCLALRLTGQGPAASPRPRSKPSPNR